MMKGTSQQVWNSRGSRTPLPTEASSSGAAASLRQDHDVDVSASNSFLAQKEYSTFENSGPVEEQNPKLVELSPPPARSMVSAAGTRVREMLGGHSNCPCHERIESDKKMENAWRIVIFISLLIAVIAYCRNDPTSESPSWHFDYNVYPRGGESDLDANNRVSLIAQIVSSRPLESLVEVSSRPNRAYARAWRQDYAVYDTGRSTVLRRACFDKIVVLNAIIDRQMNEDGGPRSVWHDPGQVKYDSILLLSPDSIVTELDTNLFDVMLPTDKLVAIAGWRENMTIRSNSGVLMFNLNHKDAYIVAKLWWEMVSPTEETCGDNNDLGILLSVIASVMDENEDLDDFVAPLSESCTGFIGNQMIKSIMPPVPGCRASYLEGSIFESRAILQQTADTVCYRFYPKCDVL
eukprot:scaffold25176_cov191-Cylindrotheca_fusiformis.AAC.1